MKSQINILKEDISDVVIIVPDLLNLIDIINNYLENFKAIDNFGYTGTYKGRKVSIIESKVDIEKISYELFELYNVDSIIGINVTQALTMDLNLNDIIVVNAAYKDSDIEESLYASSYLNFYLQDAASSLNTSISIANVYTRDAFYNSDDNYKKSYNKYGCLACDKEAFKLFECAKKLNKKSTFLLTVSDHLGTNKKMIETEIEKSLKKLIEVALESTL